MMDTTEGHAQGFCVFVRSDTAAENREAIRTLLELAHNHKNVLDPDFRRHLLWRHRLSYHSAYAKWQRAGGLVLPPFPMAVPIAEWRSQIRAVIEERSLRDLFTAQYPKAFRILTSMWELCAEAERIAAQPSTANDHLHIMETQMARVRTTMAKSREMQVNTEANPDLTDAEKTEQIKWIQELCTQRIKALLQEDGHQGSNKDEVISPE